MTPFIQQAITARRLGLALHYPLLHAAALGLGTKRTLEFGAGGSTRVLLDALRETGGRHVSISTDEKGAIAARHGIEGAAPWLHFRGRTPDDLDVLPPGPYDLILHDGSHAADVVAVDVAWALRRLRRFGLLLVHDTQHSYCGAEMREGLRRGLSGAYSMTTLPYGFGLTIIRREEGEEAVAPAVAKDGPNWTELVTVRGA